MIILHEVACRACAYISTKRSPCGGQYVASMDSLEVKNRVNVQICPPMGLGLGWAGQSVR